MSPEDVNCCWDLKRAKVESHPSPSPPLLQDIEIQVQVLPEDLSSWIPDFIDKTLSKMLDLTVGVENMSVRAKIRVAMRPLMRRMPVVGALQVRGLAWGMPSRAAAGACHGVLCCGALVL